MQELIVLSGKGGTGKTSVTASLAMLADDAVVVDCDVEAPDLHLILSPEIVDREDFVGGDAAMLNWELCIGCGRCAELCRFDAILPYGPPNRFAEQTYVVNALACEGCNLCAEICPGEAIAMVPAVCGEWFVSRTRAGTLVHAQLRPGHGNSGKLVSHLRQQARVIADQKQHSLIIGDGVPGIGCPVIASLSGASLSLAVVEPSVSALHDFERVIELARHFSVPMMACVNKYDVNVELTERIEQVARDANVDIVGRIPTDPAVVAAQMEEMSVVECGDGPAADAIREIWGRVSVRLVEAA